MTTPTPVCPECAGPFLQGHPAGPLTVQHTPGSCSLGLAQDSTSAADHERLADPLGPDSPDRAPTDAETTLAAALGLPVPGVVTVSRVTRSGAVTRREPS